MLRCACEIVVECDLTAHLKRSIAVATDSRPQPASTLHLRETMQALKEAIAAKKAALHSKRSSQHITAPTQNSTHTAEANCTPAAKRFKTRKEIEFDQQQQQLHQQQLQSRAGDNAQSSTSAQHDEDEERSNSHQNQDQESTQSDLLHPTGKRAKHNSPNRSKSPIKPTASATSASIDPNEVKRRLRRMNEPLTLFGESSQDRLARLQALELTRSEKSTNAKGSRNVFHELMQRELHKQQRQTEQESEVERARHHAQNDGISLPAPANATLNAGSEQKSVASPNSLAAATIQQSDDQAAAAPKKRQKQDQFAYKVMALETDFENDRYAFVTYFLKRILSEWKLQLERRSAADKSSIQGRNDTTVHQQTVEYLSPYMRLVKQRSVDADILLHTTSIASACLSGDYKSASESYLKMAIGNAAWPMGVTMVGIHERSGREKIETDKVAHVLNDETQRKYIQSIKRIMTYAESHYPKGAKHVDR